VTSRTLLRLSGERRFPVPPLALPAPHHLPPLADLGEIEALALFVKRAQAVKPAFDLTTANAPLVSEICRRLDGLPLAIELAAPRIRLLSPAALLCRLEHRLQTLTGGARDLPARQQTLRATIAWSHDLLTPPEQTLFRRLAVFSGGCSLAAAEAIGNEHGDVGADVLDGAESLVDASLVRQEEGGEAEPRLVLLETIREFAWEKLAERGETAELRRRHAAYFLAIAEEAAPKLRGAEAPTWLDRLDREQDNLRAARRTMEETSAAEDALRLAAALGPFWGARGHLSEGRDWLDQALAHATGVPPPAVRGQALNAAAMLAYWQGDYDQSQARFAEVLPLRPHLADGPVIGDALNGLGNNAAARGDYSHATTLFDEALQLRRALGDDSRVADSLNNLGNLAYLQGRYAQAAALDDEALELRRTIGDQRLLALSLHERGNVAHALGDTAVAGARWQEALMLLRELQDRHGIALVLNALGVLAEEENALDQATARFSEALTLQRELGDQWGIANALSNLGTCALKQGDPSRAKALRGQGLAIRTRLGHKPSIATDFAELALVAMAEGDPNEAVQLFGAADSLCATLGAPLSSEQATGVQALTTLRSQLSAAAFADAWKVGQGRTLAQAIEHALQFAQA